MRPDAPLHAETATAADWRVGPSLGHVTTRPQRLPASNEVAAKRHRHAGSGVVAIATIKPVPLGKV